MKRLGVLVLGLMLLISVGLVYAANDSDVNLEGSEEVEDSVGVDSGSELSGEIGEGVEGLKSTGGEIKEGFLGILQNRIRVPSIIAEWTQKIFRVDGKIYLETIVALIGIVLLIFFIGVLGLDAFSGFVEIFSENWAKLVGGIAIVVLFVFLDWIDVLVNSLLELFEGALFVDKYPIVKILYLVVLFFIVFGVYSIIKKWATKEIIEVEEGAAESTVVEGAKGIRLAAEFFKELASS